MNRLLLRLQLISTAIQASTTHRHCTNFTNIKTEKEEFSGLIDVMGNKEEEKEDNFGTTIPQASRVSVGQILKDAIGEEENTKRNNNNNNKENNNSNSPYKVQIADRYGMPSEIQPGAPQSFEELISLCPTENFREQLQQLCTSRRWSELTAVQKATIPLILENRDVLCVAPTATGKTFCYVFPTMLRLLLNMKGHGNNNINSGGGDDDDVINHSNVEKLLKDKIKRGEVCRYCELSIAEVKVCPMTGTLHPPIPEYDSNKELRSTMSLNELTSVSEPQLLILVPTSQLVMQVYQLFRQLHSDFRIRFLVRASSAEEQKKHIKALEEGCDVLITTPATMLPALYKRKLSLRKVKALVLDEVDDLVSVNHFEKIKIIFGALPKGHLRPQRLLFAATLPPVAYQMIRDQMLLPSHRFVLADIATDKLGHPLVEGHITGNSSITHVVFMLSQVEKISKLAWLYSSGKLREDQRTLIFCNSRHNVNYVSDKLKQLIPGLHVSSLTSHSSPTAKMGVMKLFQSGASTCLVCTDILSRGIDFKNVVYVVHYDTPNDIETWLHRTGRCGRHGLQGYCYTFFQPESVRLAKPLVAHLRQTKQLIPPKLQEYARQSLVDTFKSSLFYHPTRPYRAGAPIQKHPVMGRGTPRFPDYKQERLNKNFRPL